MIKTVTAMFRLPKNLNNNTPETDRLVASYVLEALYNGKKLYKCNKKVIVYDDGEKGFYTDARYARLDTGYKLYDITHDVFNIVKREIADNGWRLVRRDWTTQGVLNYSYTLVSALSLDDVDNVNKQIVV